MWPVVVVQDEVGEEFGQFVIVVPRLGGKPLLEATHEAFGDAIGLWSMTCDQDMDELLRAHQFTEDVRLEMHASIGDQKEQLWRQQDTQGLGDHVSCHSRTGYEQWKSQALPSTVVSDDQNGNPGGHNGQGGETFAQVLPLFTPLGIFLRPLLLLLLTLKTQLLPVTILGLVLVALGDPVYVGLAAALDLLASSFVTQCTPSLIFLLASLANLPSLVT